MGALSVFELADRRLLEAVAADSGRASESIYGDQQSGFRQSVVALKAGAELSEHRNPGDATALVIRGAAVLKSGTDSWEGKAGDLLIVPRGSHSLHALEDSVLLLTIAVSGRVSQP
jgi:quercetin dioxygenase-like cupin family protein